MQMRTVKLSSNDEALNLVMEYILVFIMATIVFTILISSTQALFIESPSKMVSKNQFMDVGNDIDAKLIDTYLVAPRDGSISTTFDIPSDIVGYGYNVQISPALNQNNQQVDQEVNIVSDRYPDVGVRLTLNGVNSTISINGSTSSHNAVHTIVYSSK